MTDPERDAKTSPLDDLRAGLGLLFRAARSAVEQLPTDRIEGAVKEGAKEVEKAMETVASEVEKVFARATGTAPPPAPRAPRPPEAADHHAAPPAPEPHHDDAYAPEPPRGPRVE